MQENDVAWRLAEWVRGFRLSDASPFAVARAKLLFLDTLACALAARGHPVVEQAKATARRFGRGREATLLGTRSRLSIPAAAFVNGAQIRALDWNDIYWGPRQGGHPSDLLGALLAVGQAQGTSGRDLLAAQLIGYEIYCRAADLMAPDGPVDHTTAGGLAAAAMVARLLRLETAPMAEALRLAATTGIAASAWRIGKIASGKGLAGALAVHSGLLAAYMAAAGVTGPRRALEAPRGLAGFLADDANAADLVPPPGAALKIESVAAKLYPCIGTAQAAIAAALELRQHLGGQVTRAAAVFLHLRDLPVIRHQASEQSRRPATAETADHSLYFLTAAALLDGAVTPATFARGRWRDAEVLALMERVTVLPDIAESPGQGSFPARLALHFDNGAVQVADQPHSPGDPGAANQEFRIVDKVHVAAPDFIGHRADRLVFEVDNLDKATSLAGLLTVLCTPERVGQVRSP